MLKRLLSLEPAIVRAVLGALVIVVGAIGFDVTGVAERIDVAWTALFAAAPLVVGWWTRQAVTPNAKVVEHIETTPAGHPDLVVAGEANEFVETGVAIRIQDAH